MEALAVSLDKSVDTQLKERNFINSCVDTQVNLLKMFTIHKIMLSNL